MRFHYFLVLACLSSLCLPAKASSTPLDLTAAEKADLEERITGFYSDPKDPLPMNRYIPKFRVSTGLPSHPNSVLQGKVDSSALPLEKTAGLKLSPWFLKAETEFYSTHKRPQTRAEAANDDQVESLTDGYTDVDYRLSELPNSGEVAQGVWSDDYWKTQMGQTSFRYGEGKTFKHYKEAIQDYEEPRAFTSLLRLHSLEDVTSAILNWSPAEKYDLTVGDRRFTLTNEEKDVGASDRGEDGDVESWMGICHGWASAAIFAPRPVHPVTVVGARGIPVKWFPDDLRAILSLSWANADPEVNFAGENCEQKNPETYPNGRIKDQSCFSTNPATLHLALANMIGRAKQSFIIDASFDYEIWNQPMKSYQFTYFNPLSPSKRSDDWREVAVDYDDSFKARDRFQHPLTRGKRQRDGSWDDSGVKKVVGVIATLVYLEEITPTATDVSPEDVETRVTYTYDLELYDDHGLTPEGGEWHDNTHPNFDWIPVKDSVAAADEDKTDYGFDGEAGPREALTKAAVKASGDGMPLCQVIKALLKTSADSGAGDYSCGTEHRPHGHGHGGGPGWHHRPHHWHGGW